MTTALAARLAEQVEVQHRLLELADSQALALRDGDLEALRAIVAEQEASVLESGRLERERAEEARRLCGALGLAADATIAELAAVLPNDEAAAVERESRALRLAVAELREASSRNRALIEQELALIDDVVRHVIVGEPTSYNGRELPVVPRRLLDREA